MDELKKNIKEIAEEAAIKHGFFLVELNFRGNNQNKIIEIYIDGEKSISADNCAEVSRDIATVVDEKDLIKGSYRLDVSSPGIDKPLIYLKQFPKHLNRNFEIEYIKNDETISFTGKLTEVNEDFLTFVDKKSNTYLIKFNDIKQAKVIISFS